MPFILIYITNPDKETAHKVSKRLLEKRLAACANIFPIGSAYWWEGKIEKTNEWVAIVKTTKEKFKEIEKEIRKIHPYKVPCIMKISVSANADYEKWLKGEIR